MHKYTKEFDRWNEKQKEIQNRDERSLFIHIREVWWTSVGVNIGTEIDGKHEYFERPVLILRKLGRKQFFGIPITSSIKEGVFYVPVYYEEKRTTACVSQGRVFSNKRLLRKIGRMQEEYYKAVLKRFMTLMESGHIKQRTPA